jgi:hypothetical protein
VSIDIALSSTEELRANLPASLDIGASVRSTTPHLQPVDDPEEVFVGSQEAWWRFFAQRALPVQHEGA